MYVTEETWTIIEHKIEHYVRATGHEKVNAVRIEPVITCLDIYVRQHSVN